MIFPCSTCLLNTQIFTLLTAKQIGKAGSSRKINGEASFLDLQHPRRRHQRLTGEKSDFLEKRRTVVLDAL